MNMNKFLLRKWQCRKTIIVSVKHKTDKGWEVEDKGGLKLKKKLMLKWQYILPLNVSNGFVIDHALEFNYPYRN